MIKVFIIDDHQVIIEGIRSLLEGEDSIEWMGSTKLPDELMAILSRKLPDVLLMDINLPQKSGLELCKEVKEKYQSPEYIFVLDDLADELHRRSLTTFLKKHRHFKAKIIVSSQHLNDLLPQARRQLDYWILFQGHPEGKVDEIHRSADLAIPKSEFYEMYKFAT